MEFTPCLSIAQEKEDRQNLCLHGESGLYSDYKAKQETSEFKVK